MRLSVPICMPIKGNTVASRFTITADIVVDKVVYVLANNFDLWEWRNAAARLLFSLQLKQEALSLWRARRSFAPQKWHLAR